MKLRKRIWIPVLVLLLLGSCVLARVTRYSLHFEAAGWEWVSTHAWLGCPTCTGSMERFTFRGQPVPLPNVGPLQFDLFTPVGQVSYWDQEVGYRSYAWGDLKLPQSDEVITQAELDRGYYETWREDPAASQPTSHNSGGRKKGTPEHWCWGISSSVERWLDPTLINDLDW